MDDQYEELTNGTIKVTFKGEFPQNHIEVFYHNSLMCEYDHAITEYPFENSFYTLSLTEMKQSYKDFFDDCCQFLEKPEEKPQNLQTIAGGFFGSIQSRMKKIINENAKPKVQSAYIIKMINKGLLYPDGRRVIGKLEDVAIYLKDEENIKITEHFLIETFRKSDGKPYSSGAAKKALNTANTEPIVEK
jgi:hypothetical protein